MRKRWICCCFVLLLVGVLLGQARVCAALEDTSVRVDLQTACSVVFTPGGQGAFIEQGLPRTKSVWVQVVLKSGLFGNLEADQIPQVEADAGWVFVGWRVVAEPSQLDQTSGPNAQQEERENLLLPWKIAYLGYPDPKKIYSSDALKQLDFSPEGERVWRISAVYREELEEGKNSVNLFRSRFDEDAKKRLQPVAATGERPDSRALLLCWGAGLGLLGGLSARFWRSRGCTR